MTTLQTSKIKLVVRLLGHDPSTFVRIPWRVACSTFQDEN